MCRILAFTAYRLHIIIIILIYDCIPSTGISWWFSDTYLGQKTIHHSFVGDCSQLQTFFLLYIATAQGLIWTTIFSLSNRHYNRRKCVDDTLLEIKLPKASLRSMVHWNSLLKYSWTQNSCRLRLCRERQVFFSSFVLCPVFTNTQRFFLKWFDKM